MNAQQKQVEKERILVDLNQPYKVTEDERKQVAFKENKLVSSWMIRLAVNMRWPQSMPATESRIWLLIYDQLFAEPGKLSLSKTEFDWLLDVVENCDYQASVTSWRWTLVKYLQELNRQHVA